VIHLVSIIVPCYNQAQYLDDCLQSVLLQSYQNWECIIVSDGSPDNTAIIASVWTARDPRFKYIYKENGGLSSARNAGLDIAAGAYIQFLDADDFLHQHKLDYSMSQLVHVPYDLIVTNYETITIDPKNTLPPFYQLADTCFNFESVLFRWDVDFAIPIHCALIKNDFFKNFRFPNHLKAKEDWVMWISIFKNNPNYRFIDKPYALYRMHANSMTVDQESMRTNQIKAFLYIKNIVDEADYDKLMTLVLSRLYSSCSVAENNLVKIKKSRTYQLGSVISNAVHKMKNLFTFKLWFFE